MNKQEASLLLTKRVLLPRTELLVKKRVKREYILTWNANLIALGFILSSDVIEECANYLSKEEFDIWASELQDLLIKHNGSRHNMKPMYPDFPKQVMEASDMELFFNALIHYCTNGKWLPEYENALKLRTESILKPKIIELTSEKELVSYIEILAESRVAMSPQQLQIFDFLISEYGEFIHSTTYTMPNKENMAHVIHSIAKYKFKEKNTWHKHLAQHNVKTITDVLRLTIAFLGGDVSLSESCSFRSIKRSDRRFLLSLIDELFKDNSHQILEDAARYQSLWVIILEQLHPGDYDKRFPYAFKFATSVREDKLKTWYSKLEKAYSRKDLNTVLDMLESRPGEFARRLERTIREAYSDKISGHNIAVNVVERFAKVAHKVDNGILLQLVSYFTDKYDNYDKEIDHRTFFPKGNISKIYLLPETREKLPIFMLFQCIATCENALIQKYESREALGNVYIDPAINGFVVPLKLRNAANQLHTISRGSKFKLPEEVNVIRLYIWWENLTKGSTMWKDSIDIDLSTMFYDENFNKLEDSVSYCNLRIDGACHSGDIVDAPNGAAEFIDLEIDTLLDKEVRYISMILNSFTDENFNKIPECFAGAMVLDEIIEGETVFDPAKSIIRSDISTESAICVPMVFDLKERTITWIDSIAPSYTKLPNNIENNKGALANLVRGIMTTSYPNLVNLIKLNIAARKGVLVNNKEDADIIFALEEGITPYDLEILNSQWL